MNYCIVGGSGFIGTELVQLFKNKNVQNFYIIDKVSSSSFPEITSIADVRSIEDLRSKICNVSTIINLAAEHKDNIRPIDLYYDVNVKGAENICKIAKEKNIKNIIFTSSCAVYGSTNTATDEDGEIKPFNDYGKSKFLAEKIYQKWQEEAPDERTLTIIRPTVVFGKKNRGNVFNMLNQINKNKFVMIGKGDNCKSMAYVENVASFIYYCSKFSVGNHLYNYVDKPDYSMNELYSFCANIMQKNNTRFRLPFILGLSIGFVFDFLSFLIRKDLILSSVRVRKFCSDTVFLSSVESTGFKAPKSIRKGLEIMILHDFMSEDV